MATRTSSQTDLAVIKNDLVYIKSDLQEIKQSVTHGYVTKDEFEPVRRIVYGLVSIILIAVVGAVVSLVISE